MHGATTATKEKAEMTLSLAQLLARNPGRPLWEVLGDLLNSADAVYLDAKAQIPQDAPPTVEQLDRLRTDILGLGQLLKTAVQTGLYAKLAEQAQRQLDEEARLVAQAIIAGVDAVHLDPDTRQRMLDAAHAYLVNQDAQSSSTGVPSGVPALPRPAGSDARLSSLDSPEPPAESSEDPPPPPVRGQVMLPDESGGAARLRALRERAARERQGR